MAEKIRGEDLLRTLVKRTRLTWYVFTAVLIVFLMALAVLCAFLDGLFSNVSYWDFWREFLGAPLIIAYILVVYPYMSRLGRKAVQTFRDLQSPDNTGPVSEIVFLPNRRREWASVAVGMIFWILLQRPWNWEWGVDALWLYVYHLLAFSLLFGLLGWLIYNSIADSRYLSRLSRRELKLDIFDTSVLLPVARYSLAVSFAFLGGISISLIFQTYESLLMWMNITIYAVLILATVLIFFLSLWNTHSTIAAAKHHELSFARERLEDSIRELREASTHGQPQNQADIYSAVAAWGIYERRVREVREWPFNAGILRKLAASTLAPAVVYLIKILVGVPLGLF